ncbi:MAG: GNAT family N-acetyltransferase [Clostridia bacterium]|jgi:ribosomal protein S18 acetylase RimI-like enzyme|nr:GNAT family N-acetyltransferase [Clostridia bacterium]
MQIVNYKEKYKNDLDYLQIEQWGEGANIEDVGNNLDKYNARIAEEDDKLIGALVWHKEDEKTCFIDYIILRPNYQKKGYGTDLLSDLLSSLNKEQFDKVECEAIDVLGHCNAKKLLESFGFEEQYSVASYWGEKYPDYYCKDCGSKPCRCTMHKYIKYLK